MQSYNCDRKPYQNDDDDDDGDDDNDAVVVVAVKWLKDYRYHNHKLFGRYL